MGELALLAVICFIAMVSPGPDFILVTRNALMYPRRQALATALGIISGCLIHAAYCILGLALIITKSIVAYSVIKYAGACYLIYLGLKGIFSRAPGAALNGPVGPREITAWEAFVQGFLCNLLNPKLAVFLLSLFTQFISPGATMGEKAMVAGVFVTESAIYLPTLVLLLQSRAIQEFFNRARGAIDGVCGALLVYLGMRVALAKD